MKIIVYDLIFVLAAEASLKNGVNALSKMALKELGFLSKCSNFIHFGLYDLVQISPACSPKRYQILYGNTLKIAVLAFATVVRKSFKGKFNANIDFLIKYFRLPLLTQTLEV